MPTFEIATLRAPERPLRCGYWHFGALERCIRVLGSPGTTFQCVLAYMCQVVPGHFAAVALQWQKFCGQIHIERSGQHY